MWQAGATFGQDAAPALHDWFIRLAGQWRVVREARDGSCFEGVATFTPAGDNFLDLEERGELVLPGGETLPASRRWHWRLSAGNMLEINYPQEAGGQPYHRFRLVREAGMWMGEAEHLCGRDIYRARYRLGVDELRIDHRILGPAKDYLLNARYQRSWPAIEEKLVKIFLAATRPDSGIG